MPKKKIPDLSLPSSWKDLTPKSARRPATRAALRKRWSFGLKIFSFAVIFLLGGMGTFFVIRNNPQPNLSGINAESFSPKIKNIDFSSDGSLNLEWFGNWFGPLRNLSLSDLDIESIHQSLVEEVQIVSAVVTRVFPSTLRISITERKPVMVLRLKSKHSGFIDWLVSSDGTLFKGEGYSSASLALLPSLSIHPNQLNKKKGGQGFEPLQAISHVSPLLELARREYPDLYRNWQIVSYERPNQSDPGAHILIQSKRVNRIRFSPRGFADQMKRLRYMLKEPSFAKARRIRSIDLSHDRSVFAKI